MIVTKRFVTLIEMIIVMVLIGLILGIVAYNYTGSLEEGKAFKTKTGIEKLQNILNLMIAEDSDNEARVSSEWETMIKQSPLVSNPEALTKDGWGEKYTVRVDEEGRVVVTSQKYQEYQRSHPGSMFKEQKSE